MDTLNTIIIISLAVFAIGSLSFLFLRKRNTQPIQSLASQSPATYQMKLQAYERLIVLANRIALPDLISRMNQPGLSAREMQMLLTQTIKQEFDHNITQQLYVSADAWSAIKNLKEQNMLIVNQCAGSLTATATGADLNKQVLEFLMNDKKGNLYEIVSEVLSYEAKRVL
jgi:hypothetical protein